MSLRTVNQNLLPILLALLRERNVTKAARQLGLSQPAVSKALTQLRAVLGDPLLVRSGNQSVLTKRAEELIRPVAAVCEDLERIWHAPVFDPAQSRREFVIAGADYSAMMIVPAVAKALAEQAPGVSMRFVDLVPEVLLDGNIDVDFSMAPRVLIPEALVEAGCMMPLFIDEFVAVVTRDHPLARKGGSTPDAIARTPSIAFGNEQHLVPSALKDTTVLSVAGSPTLATVQQFLTQPILALLTGSMAVVPQRLVELIAPGFPLHVLHGVAPQMQVDMVLAWSTRRDGDADHIWFRNLVASHLRDYRFRRSRKAMQAFAR